MTGWLLDINVLSELRRKRPEPAVEPFIAKQRLSDLFVSEVTFAEIRFSIELIGDPERRADLRHWLDQRLRPLSGRRALPITEDILLQWRLMIEAGHKRGHTFSHPDVLIAATAAEHGLTVATRNTGEFAAAGVAVVNPWTYCICFSAEESLSVPGFSLRRLVAGVEPSRSHAEQLRRVREIPAREELGPTGGRRADPRGGGTWAIQRFGIQFPGRQQQGIAPSIEAVAAPPQDPGPVGSVLIFSVDRLAPIPCEVTW